MRLLKALLRPRAAAPRYFVDVAASYDFEALGHDTAYYVCDTKLPRRIIAQFVSALQADDYVRFLNANEAQ